VIRFKSIISRIVILHVIAVAITSILMSLALSWLLNIATNNIHNNAMEDQALTLAQHLVPQADGSQRAIEVHIFPEAMRGTGEGHYAWDLRPQSTMTNANVEHAVTAVDGQTLTLKYKDGEKKIIVPPEATVVTYTTGDKSELKPGTKIFVAAAKNLPDGSLEAPRINYGKDGLTPPM